MLEEKNKQKKEIKSENFESDYISNLLRKIVDLEIKYNLMSERISNVEAHLSLAFDEIEEIKPISKEQSPAEVEKATKYEEINENGTRK